MASLSFTRRGGSEAEYQIYKALYSTGRKEPRDFMFKPPGTNDLSFLVDAPRIGLKVGVRDGASLLTDVGGGMVPRVEYIGEASALNDGRSALSAALGA